MPHTLRELYFSINLDEADTWIVGYVATEGFDWTGLT